MKSNVSNILNWYYQNKRDLSWRKVNDPFYVWISEIMLQQTRIEAVIDYYERFLKEIPTVEVLANIEEEKLLKLWEGLGYYNRARNLKKSAQIIMKDYQGNFPNTYEELLTLPGIGEYTASAISSICFQEKKAVIDGNVLRIFTRFYNDNSNISQNSTKQKVKQELEKILPKEAGDFNEALMEIGETICIPNGMPLCDICPLKNNCLAKKNQNYFDFPVKSEKKKKKELYYTVFIYRYQDQIAIRKRKEKTILNNLWEFPNEEEKFKIQDVKHYLQEQKISYRKIQKWIDSSHTFTHQVWHMTSYLIDLDDKLECSEYIFEKVDVIKEKYAIPSVFQPFLMKL